MEFPDWHWQTVVTETSIGDTWALNDWIELEHALDSSIGPETSVRPSADQPPEKESHPFVAPVPTPVVVCQDRQATVEILSQGINQLLGVRYRPALCVKLQNEIMKFAERNLMDETGKYVWAAFLFQRLPGSNVLSKTELVVSLMDLFISKLVTHPAERKMLSGWLKKEAGAFVQFLAQAK
jgi:hypothetical protein